MREDDAFLKDDHSDMAKTIPVHLADIHSQAAIKLRFVWYAERQWMK
jgi:hypothetical protein